jgi:hypothetical protein
VRCRLQEQRHARRSPVQGSAKDAAVVEESGTSFATEAHCPCNPCQRRWRRAARKAGGRGSPSLRDGCTATSGSAERDHKRPRLTTQYTLSWGKAATSQLTVIPPVAAVVTLAGEAAETEAVAPSIRNAIHASSFVGLAVAVSEKLLGSAGVAEEAPDRRSGRRSSRSTPSRPPAERAAICQRRMELEAPQPTPLVTNYVRSCSRSASTSGSATW